jgi:hypothetical protein
VGVEVFLVRRGERVLHLPLTYRGEPLTGTDAELIGTMEHSVLGTRWVYDGREDPVAIGCFERALRGAQEPAALEVWDGGRLVERADSGVRLRCETGAVDASPSGPARTEARRPRLEIRRDVSADVDGDPVNRTRLVAEWDGGHAVVAVLWS